jgi:serine/threonine protein kinase
VLFDFSLTTAAASATQAGTPPYLDPFLTGSRDRFDSAAERYAASVVPFEMATGATPVYGHAADPETSPTRPGWCRNCSTRRWPGRSRAADGDGPAWHAAGDRYCSA